MLLHLAPNWLSGAAADVTYVYQGYRTAHNAVAAPAGNSGSCLHACKTRTGMTICCPRTDLFSKGLQAGQSSIADPGFGTFPTVAGEVQD